MIAELRIQGLGIIDSAEIEPGPGLTCVTGETGAGKTMLLTAIDLLRGAKCPPSLVSAERVRVEAVLAANPEISALVAELGGETGDDGIIVARVVPREGRARAFVGGASVPAGQMAEVTGEAVVVHGQAEQLRLRSSARQRLLLDAFGGAPLRTAKDAYQRTYQELTDARTALQALNEQRASVAAQSEELRDGLAAINAVDPQPDEDEALRAEAERLTNIEDLLLAAEGARTALSGDNEGGDAASLVAQASRNLHRGALFDESLAGMSQRAQEIAMLISELAADVSSYAADLEADPARLAWVLQRRADLARLIRRFGSLEEVFAWADDAHARLAELDDVVGAEKLTEEVRRLEALAADQAAELSRRRTVAAARLSEAVTAELAGLAMPDARFHAVVEQHAVDPAKPGQDGAAGGGALMVGGKFVHANREGIDEVLFLLAAHKGAQPTALGVGASGGELSRVMLALEVALAGQSAGDNAGNGTLPTMIFDEIDAGVGGKAAVEIGRRLARLAGHTQVIVVTHLPQVAAFAGTHIRVRKGSSGAVTTASVEQISGDERRQEIARMLAGQDDSDHALAHADELLALADQ